MSKHTPGPWFSPDGKTIKQDYRTIGLTEAAGCMIASVMGGPTSGPAFIEVAEEVEANTRLIAASPDLLTALVSVVENAEQRAFEDWLQQVSPSGDVDAVHAQWLESGEHLEFTESWAEQLDAIDKARVKP